jgi:hypothetical protein
LARAECAVSFAPVGAGSLSAVAVGERPPSSAAPGDFAQLEIQLTERSGHGIAAGTAYTNQLACNGLIETITVPVTATGKPFVKGTAFGQATLFDCGPTFCGSASVSHGVKLSKAVPK